MAYHDDRLPLGNNHGRLPAALSAIRYRRGPCSSGGARAGRHPSAALADLAAATPAPAIADAGDDPALAGAHAAGYLRAWAALGMMVVMEKSHSLIATMWAVAW